LVYSFQKHVYFWKEFCIMMLSKKNLYLVIILCFLFFYKDGNAQLLPIEHWHQKSGMNSPQYYDGLQGDDGLMWFINRTGLCSFDGFAWENISIPTISDVSGMCLKQNGNILVYAHAFPNILEYNVKEKTWLIPTQIHKGESVGLIRKITSGTYNNNPYLAACVKQRGLFFYQDSVWNDISSLVDYNKDLFKVKTCEGGFLCATDKGIYKILLSDSVATFTSEKLPSIKEDPAVKGVFVENYFGTERIWIINNIELGYIENNKYYRHSDAPNDTWNNEFPMSLFVDRFRTIWTGVITKAFMQLRDDTEFRPIGVHSGFSGEGVTFFASDLEQNIWMGTLRGLDKILPLVFLSYNSENGLLEDEVVVIKEFSNGDLWFGHNYGLTKFSNGKYQHFILPKIRQSGYFRIMSIVEEKSGSLLVANNGHNIYRLYPSGKWEVIPLKIGDSKIWDMELATNDRLWVLTNNELLLLSLKDFSIIDFCHEKGSFRKIVEIGGLPYFATTSKGVFVKNNGTFKRHSYADKAGHPKNSTYTLCKLPDGRIIVGTKSGIVELRSGRLLDIQGVLSQLDIPIYSLMVDDNNKLWIGTENGVYVLEEGVLTSMNYEKGLIGLEANRSALCQLSNGNILVGTNKGVSIYNPYYDDSIDPQFEIYSLNVFSGDKQISATKPHILPYDQNSLKFTYKAVYFGNPDDLWYKLELEGADNSFIILKGNAMRQYDYHNLPPGEYKFSVSCSILGENWSDPVSTSTIKIRYPFWQTYWFLLIIILAIFSILFFLSRFLVQLRYGRKLEKEVEKKTKILKDANTTKDTFFSIIAHDLRAPFSAIMGLSEVLKDEYKTLSRDEIASFSSSIFMASESTFRLLENLLEWARTQSGQISNNPEFFELEPLVSEILNVLSPSIKSKNISITPHLENPTVFADKHMIHTVIRNLISNAIKFTNANGKISIEMGKSNQFVYISIVDNGIGMDEKTKKNLFNTSSFSRSKGTAGESGSGFGLALSKDFLELNNGEISFESTLGKGSKFTIFIPLQKSDKNRG